jgi:hypothetical protein
MLNYITDTSEVNKNSATIPFSLRHKTITFFTLLPFFPSITIKYTPDKSLIDSLLPD